MVEMKSAKKGLNNSPIRLLLLKAQNFFYFFFAKYVLCGTEVTVDFDFLIFIEIILEVVNCEGIYRR